MESITKAQAIFKPLLQQFCEETMHLQIDENFSSVFLPNTMDGYDTAKKKIFYFGRDTNGWCNISLLRKYYQSNQLEKYIEANDKFLKKKEFLFSKTNTEFSFWNLVINLHLCLKGIKEFVKVDATFFNSKYASLIDDFGYGNSNALEVKQNLINQGIWKNLNIPSYLEIKSKSAIFDKLIHTINAYQPDNVVIFNWTKKYEPFLEGLEYRIEKTSKVNEHFWIIELKDSNTRIIRTLHPRTLIYSYANINTFINDISDHIF